MAQIVVVDYGMGNLRSVAKAIEHVATNQQVIISSDANEIANAERVVFPGQGAARDCMRELKDRNLTQVILSAAKEKPFLGICMGMQVLLKHSEENNGIDCLALYDGNVRFFGNDLKNEKNEKLKIPHMGWNGVDQKMDHPLWHNINNHSRFYFVHSYFMDPADKNLVAATSQYGNEFVSAIAKDNVFAVQCHPEKSAQDGLQLLKNFTQWNGQ
ncbi:Imidazole glycerol phosphate synthase amidotransferase subunit [hydrothermal vent metagenome]|uniref:Imidazole glycerol phosphate synthase amidotransferase subunit n=1 Tax=hydrothermal vent metagenome TaxID=652676 RepID=A0A3B0XXX0_9ZZZZ